MAMTASGPRENSMGCYCKSQSGSYKTCLGDLFSATWMENVDKVDTITEIIILKILRKSDLCYTAYKSIPVHLGEVIDCV